MNNKGDILNKSISAMCSPDNEDIIVIGNSKGAQIDTDYIEKISPNSIMVKNAKNNPSEYAVITLNPALDSVKYNLLLSAYTAASQSKEVNIDLSV